MMLIAIFSFGVHAQEVFAEGSIPQFNVQNFRPALGRQDMLWVNETRIAHTKTFSFRNMFGVAEKSAKRRLGARKSRRTFIYDGGVKWLIRPIPGPVLSEFLGIQGISLRQIRLTGQKDDVWMPGP